MNILNKVFDQIYCINLDKRKDRWKECQEEFSKYDLNVKRVSAVDGNPGVEVNSGFLKKWPGAVGCLLSHLKIIKDAKQNNYKQILILEDDIHFLEDCFSRFETDFEDVPEDWEMLYLSANFKHFMKRIKSEEQLQKVKNNIFIAKKCLTTHSYALKNKIYDDIIIELEKLTNPIDVIYMHNIQVNYRCYIINPGITTQRDCFSNITNHISKNSKFID